VDFQIGIGTLLALGKVNLLLVVLLAALLEHDVRRHGAGAGGEIQRQHPAVLPDE
jgi:hypothetical protein